MQIKPIRNDDDLRAALARLEAVFQAPVGSPEADEMEVLVALVEAYENRQYPIGAPDPVEVIKFRMEQHAPMAKDLEPYIGSSGRGSVVLNRKYPRASAWRSACEIASGFVMRACRPLRSGL